MKSAIVVYALVVACGGFAQSYSAYGSAKRRASMIAPMMPVYSQAAAPQYYDSRTPASYLQSPPQYLSVPQYLQQQQQPQPQQQDYRASPSGYYYYPQEREPYQEPLYGIPTYHGDYNPKPYYFAQPSYMSQDDRLETTNPLDYLHEEILQENERERNNAAFMQNLALYNKQVDGIQGRQQQLQQIQDMYNLRSTNEFDDYDVVEQPSDWYDQTSILVEPAYDSYIPQQQQPQFLPLRSADYDDEMVKELKNLKQNRNNNKAAAVRGYEVPRQAAIWPSQVEEDEPETYDEDEWINWGGQKRSIQPKKDFADGKQASPQQQQQTVGKQSKHSPAKVTVTSSPSTSSSATTTTTTTTTTTEGSKLLGKLHKGQKEIFLPRPAAPVRRPFSESIMKSLGKGSEESEQQSPSPIYKTIKQIIDMEQSLSHLSDNQLPTSKIRKRFVTNEEALAQQLNGLKRTSK